MNYPDVPGYNVPGPSKDAAKQVRRRASSQAKRILALLKSVPAGLTKDEIADRLGLRDDAVSKRLSQLFNATIPEIRQTGQRRLSNSGVLVNVWQAFLDEDETENG